MVGTSGQTVVILGGGWGGLAAASALRDVLPAEHRIVVIERSATFSLCTSYLWLMTGERARSADVRRELSKLARPGIEWTHSEVERIDPSTRTVETGVGRFEADHLVIALGAELSHDDVPGLAENADDLYDAEGAAAAGRSLMTLHEGRVVVLVTRVPFRCPAAPYEAAFLVDSLLRHMGVRDRVEVALYTPEKQPMPVTGPAIGDALRSMLAERHIDYHPERAVVRVDGSSRTAVFDGEDVPFDLLIAVPPHRAPRVVAEAGLTDGTGYVPVHPQTLEILAEPETLETRYPGVFAIGDVTAIRLHNGMLLPKAGVFAEAQARVVADGIAAQIRGEDVRTRFDGKGFCYVEVGDGMAAYGAGDFYAYPGPRVTLEPASAAHKKAKQEFERVLDTWFSP